MSTHDMIRFAVIEHALTPEQIGIEMYRASRGCEYPPSLKWCSEHVCAALNGRIGISSAAAYFVITLEVSNKSFRRAASMG